MTNSRSRILFEKLISIFKEIYPIWKKTNSKELGYFRMDKDELNGYTDLFENQIPYINTKDLDVLKKQLLGPYNVNHKDFPPSPVHLATWLPAINRQNRPKSPLEVSNREIEEIKPTTEETYEEKILYAPRAYYIAARGNGKKIAGKEFPQFRCSQEEIDALDEHYKDLLDVIETIRSTNPRFYRTSMEIQANYNAYRYSYEKILGVKASKDSVRCVRKFFENGPYFLDCVSEWGGPESVTRMLDFLRQTELWPELKNIEISFIFKNKGDDL